MKHFVSYYEMTVSSGNSSRLMVLATDSVIDPELARRFSVGIWQKLEHTIQNPVHETA